MATLNRVQSGVWVDTVTVKTINLKNSIYILIQKNQKYV